MSVQAGSQTRRLVELPTLRFEGSPKLHQPDPATRNMLIFGGVSVALFG
jgi:hypothetical protein